MGDGLLLWSKLFLYKPLPVAAEGGLFLFIEIRQRAVSIHAALMSGDKRRPKFGRRYLFYFNPHRPRERRLFLFAVRCGALRLQVGVDRVLEVLQDALIFRLWNPLYPPSNHLQPVSTLVVGQLQLRGLSRGRRSRFGWLGGAAGVLEVKNRINQILTVLVKGTVFFYVVVFGI